MWTLNFDATCVEVICKNKLSLVAKLSKSESCRSVQNERVAIIARWCSKGIGDVAPTSEWAKVVNRALFTLLANLWTCTGLHCLPLCASLKWQRNHSRIGNNSSTQPVGNSPTSQDHLFTFLNLCPTWVQVKLRILTIQLIPKSGTSERTGTAPLAKLARSYLVQSLHKVKNNNYQN